MSDRLRASVLPSVGVIMVSMLSIQVGASFAKGIFPAIGAAGLSSLRQIFGAVMLAVAFRIWRLDLRSSIRPALLVYGASLGIMNMLFYLALRTLPLGIAVSLEFTGPLAVAILNSRRSLDIPWIVLAIAGIVCLTQLRGASAADPLGVTLALGAGACWALYIVFGQRAAEGHGMSTAAVGCVIAAIVAAPIGIAAAGTKMWSPSIVPAALAVAFLSTALPYALEMYALTRLPARTFGILMSVEPALAGSIGWIFLHEALSTVQCAGVVAIVAASAGTTLTSAYPASAPVPD
jgi:inner membrane transporter RhtA